MATLEQKLLTELKGIGDYTAQVYERRAEWEKQLRSTAIANALAELAGYLRNNSHGNAGKPELVRGDVAPSLCFPDQRLDADTRELGARLSFDQLLNGMIAVHYIPAVVVGKDEPDPVRVPEVLALVEPKELTNAGKVQVAPYVLTFMRKVRESHWANDGTLDPKPNPVREELRRDLGLDG